MRTAKKVIIVKRGSHLAQLACRVMRSHAIALVWGRTIHLYGADPNHLLSNQNWLAHELVHVRQFESKGIVNFLYLYLRDWMKHGYYNNRYEIEARDASNHLDMDAIFEHYNFEIK